MYIVNGLYGGCADIVTAVIDSSDVEFFSQGMYINFTEEREVLNRAIDPTQEADIYAMAIHLKDSFKSIQTTLEKRHIEPKTNKNNSIFKYIYVDPGSEKTIEWINNRTRILLEEYIPMNVEQMHRARIIQKYHSDIVITVDDILEGNLIEKLSTTIDTPLDTRLYESWLSLIRYDFPFN